MSAFSGVLPADHQFVVASKQVKGDEDMPRWEASEAYQVKPVPSYQV